jgi:hypothetical protein
VLGGRSVIRAARRGSILAGVAILLGAASATVQQSWRGWLEPRSISSIAAATATSIDETEPNDSLDLAQLIALGDTINGVIDPAGDFDFFAIDLEAGTVLDFRVVPSAGSPLSPYIALIAADSSFLGVDYGYTGEEARVLVQVQSSGRYFLAVRNGIDGGGSAYDYRLSTAAFQLDETEPNDTPATANLVTPGDTVVAAVSAGDVDFFAVDLAAGTYIGAEYTPITTWIPLELTIFDTDGATRLATDTSGYRWPRYYATEAGRYYVSARSVYGAQGLYALDLRDLPLGPGDPPTTFAQGLGSPTMAAAGLVGDVYVYDDAGDRLLHVSAAGEVTTIASDITVYSLVVDGLGDLLAGSYDSNGIAGIQRFAPDGTRSAFATDTTHGYYAFAMAVAPDGDVWAIGPIGDMRRYSPNGVVKEAWRIQTSASRMAFSPSGVLHFIPGGAVYRMTVDGPVLAVSGGSFQALAFDEDGYLYLAERSDGAVRLYDPSYNVVEAPFAAVNLDEATNLLFLRDASQAMTSRLVAAIGPGASTGYGGTLLELNPAGVRAPGYPPQPRLLRIATAALRNGLLAAPYADTLGLVDAPGAVQWALTDGNLPTGLVLDAVSGVISGIPDSSGLLTFSVRGTSGDRFGSGTFTIGIREPVLAVTDVVNSILGVADLLTEDERRFLDLQGNQNGQMDIGDVRAYLAAQGQLPALATSAMRKGAR